MLSGDYSKHQSEHETYTRSSASVTGNITLKNIRDIAARGMAGLFDAAINSKSSTIMEQDRDKILRDIETLSRNYYLTMGI